MLKFVTILFFGTLFVSEASSKPFYLGLDEEPSSVVKFKNTVVWNKLGATWVTQTPQDNLDIRTLNSKSQSYLLVNNDQKSYKTKVYSTPFYNIKRGWNYLSSHKDGVNVVKTFKSIPDVKFVYVYDRVSEAWAGYSPSSEIQKKIKLTRILSLKDIEPEHGFYVYSDNDVRVSIYTNKIEGVCEKYLNSSKYRQLISTGLDSTGTYDNKKTLSLLSRYRTHYKRGVYDDSRVSIFYEQLQVKNAPLLKYGPARPKAFFKYAREYEEKVFYMYDFKYHKCYEGVFPSNKIPPFASLKELK